MIYQRILDKFRILEVSHCVAKSLIPNQKKPSYGQLWVLDSETANEIRLQHPANTKCLPEVI